MPVPGQAAGLPLVPPNATSPLGICAIDPDTGDAYGPEMVQYTALSTAGTSTIDTGGGLYFGINLVTLGTTFTAAVFDVQGTLTNTLVGTTTLSTLGSQCFAGPSGVGVFYRGNLVIVTTGTAGIYNVLWD